MRIKKSSHAAYRVQYHLVWSTRFKRKILQGGVKSYLKIKIKEVAKYYPDWEIHVTIEFPPKYSGAHVIETIKKNTSRRLKEKFKFLKEVYWDDGGIWSVGYFFTTVGINEEVIRKYIERQWQEDSGQAELEL